MQLQGGITVRVYHALNHTLMRTFSFGRSGPTVIALGDDCYTPPNLCVEEYHFIQSLSLQDNPGGYIIAAQSCCRNYVIQNLVEPYRTGVTWSVEIPDPAISSFNSSPDLGPYPSQGFLCVNNLRSIDLSATDADGDSLAYELVTPYTAPRPTQPNPNPWTPPPFQDVTWEQGFSVSNAIPGDPSLQIDAETGMLRCNADQLGLYVFAYRVSEYRNGIKIGEVRRDLQLEVLSCFPELPPEIVQPTQDVFDISVNDQLCFDVQVSDGNTNDTLLVEAFYSGSIVDFDSPKPFRRSGFSNINGQICWKPGCIGEIGDKTLSIQLLLISKSCYGADTVFKNVQVNIENPSPDFSSLFPNIFTPNQDGINDLFKPSQLMFNECIQGFEYKIYNRWGQQVFESSPAVYAWDGQYQQNPVSEGVYYYVGNGSYNGKNLEFTGHLTLNR